VRLDQLRRKRSALILSIVGLMLMVSAVSTISVWDPDGVTLRIGMVLVTVGAAMWLPWQALIPGVLVVWLAPNIGRSLMDDYELFNTNMLLELPGLAGLGAFSCFARAALRQLEEEQLSLGLSEASKLDPKTGVYEESLLRDSINAELSRSRRFGRTFALVLVGIDEMRQRFDYRDEATWEASFAATAELLRGTRHNVDSVYRFGPAGFAMVLPESGPNEVNGMVRRLRRVGRKARPPEGEAGGPLPAFFGATFFPACATTTDDLLRRAEVALRIADKNANRIQLDSAEAPEMLPAEEMRQPEPAFLEGEDEESSEAIPLAPGVWYGPEDGDRIETDEQPPLEVYALQAPEPAVDAYAPSWQSEAPLSVLPRPHPRPILVALDGGQTARESVPSATAASIDDTLRRLQQTLELIRSLKHRSA
jgi:diguanylate cyclase (GGDEF)-like protein